MPTWLSELLPILLLLGAISLVVTRLPKVDLGHTSAFRARRFRNWFPVGLTYAFLYFGRYNLNRAADYLFDNEQFSNIYAVGTVVYGISFVINGPLSDRFGGKKTIVAAALGALVANLGMGVLAAGALPPGVIARAGHPHASDSLVHGFMALYALNMYFQSFGAVSIVKINAAWFHLRERGTFGGIFGVLISLGLYFAFDWSKLIVRNAPVPYAFYVPAMLLGLFTIINVALVKDTPGLAGHDDFDVGDASSGDDGGERLSVFAVAMTMFRNPTIVTIACIEFCSGYLRNAIMQYYPKFIRGIGATGVFVNEHWGMLLCVAGITGGMVAGVISDKVFESRRGPVSAVLYGVMIAGSLAMFAALGTAALGWVVVLMSLAIIGVHGMLSGTASMDFGGKRNVGVAVGLIDGFVYLGTALEAVVLGQVLPRGDAARDPAHWWTWPAAIVPVAVIGFVLALRVWNARVAPKGAH
ncbi:MAG: MFS transporter [Polyangiales bacterium]